MLNIVKVAVGEPKAFTPTEQFTYSGFVSFNYDQFLVNLCREVRIRKWHPNTKEWEIFGSCLAEFLDNLDKNNYEYVFLDQAQEQMFKDSFGEKEEVGVEIPTTFRFKTEPYEHQVSCLKYGLVHDSFLLGDAQGLGKTKEIIDLALARRERDGIKHCLIICGINGNKYNWEEEIKIHSNEDSWVLGTRYAKNGKRRIGSSKDKMEDLVKVPKQFFWITNIETLRVGAYKKNPKSKKSGYIYPVANKINDLIAAGEIGMIAFDEAHKAKNPDSKQGQAILSLKNVPIIPMSGTFVLNNPLDLYLPLRCIGEETSNYWLYKNRYCTFGGFGGQQIIGYRKLPELHDRLQRVMIRRRKEDVLDLPPKVYKTEYVEMNTEQKRLYSEVRAKISENLSGIKLSPDPLVELQRLRQVTGCPEVISDTIIDSSKMDRLVEIVTDAVEEGEKVVVFSQWTSMTKILKRKLSQFSPAYITGEVKEEQRIEEVNKFQKDPECKCIIGTIGAMGTGLTLNAAGTVIFLDEPWNRGIKDQAEDRAHRIGTRGTVTIVTMVSKNTIDEGIYNLVQHKGKMADYLVDGLGVKVPGAVVDYLLEYEG